MDRDTFIITVFCLVSELYAQVTAHHPVRHGGFAPALADAEVMTMEICGAYFKHQTDKDLYDYFAAHYRHFFPCLPNRSLFVRQAANLWQVKTAIWHLLVERSGQRTSPVQVIDTMPLPVCTYTRARRDRCFKTFADYGHCAAKKLDYYGFKLGTASLCRRDDYALPATVGTRPRCQSHQRFGRRFRWLVPDRQRFY